LDLAFTGVDQCWCLCAVEFRSFEHVKSGMLLHFPNTLVPPKANFYSFHSFCFLSLSCLIMPGASQSGCDDCGASFPLAAEHGDLCHKCKRLASRLPLRSIRKSCNGFSVASVVILDEIWFHVGLARFRHVEVNNALR